MSDQVFDFKVTDRVSFISFIKLLRVDLLNNPERWENKNLDDFLEAIGRYTEDVQSYYNNTNQSINADDPNWKTFADIFMGASIYE